MGKAEVQNGLPVVAVEIRVSRASTREKRPTAPWPRPNLPRCVPSPCCEPGRTRPQCCEPSGCARTDTNPTNPQLIGADLAHATARRRCGREQHVRTARTAKRTATGLIGLIRRFGRRLSVGPSSVFSRVERPRSGFVLAECPEMHSVARPEVLREPLLRQVCSAHVVCNRHLSLHFGVCILDLVGGRKPPDDIERKVRPGPPERHLRHTSCRPSRSQSMRGLALNFH